MLKEYEGSKAHWVSLKFKGAGEAEKFQALAKQSHSIDALKALGYENEAKSVINNTITMAMVSDCLHHIFEALRCFEKRKFIVGFNLLRKPLKDNLLYLSWMLGDEDKFYQDFMSGNPKELTQSKLGNFREEIFRKAIAQTPLKNFIFPAELNSILFDRKNDTGLDGWFQHAVHLVTVQHLEIQTAPQNFNFIFKDPSSEDVYYSIYENLPYVLLYLTHVIAALFNRIHEMDPGAQDALLVRSFNGFQLMCNYKPEEAHRMIREAMSGLLSCESCSNTIKITEYNAAKLLLSESVRCNKCGRITSVPFSYVF